MWRSDMAHGDVTCPICDGSGVIPGLCQCGCGQPVVIPNRTFQTKGGTKGWPRRFATGHNQRKVPPTEAGFWSLVRKGEGCWEWQGHVTPSGYGSYVMHRRAYPAHRLAYQYAVEPIPDGLMICHHCDNRKCVRPDHLYAGTHLENMRDMAVRGRAPRVPAEKHARGVQHGMAKLNDEKVYEARLRYVAGEMITELAKVYGVVAFAMRLALLGVTWAHVPFPPGLIAGQALSRSRKNRSP